MSKQVYLVFLLTVLLAGVITGWWLAAAGFIFRKHSTRRRVTVARFVTPEGKQLKVTRSPGKLSRPTYEFKDVRVPLYSSGRLVTLLEADRMYRGKTGPLCFDRPRLTRFDDRGNVTSRASSDFGWVEPSKGAAGFTVDALQFHGHLRFRVYQAGKQADAYRNKAKHSGR